MKIEVQALSIDQIIKDLGKQFKQPVTSESGELTLDLPEKLGTGFIRGISFDSGIGIIEYCCTFYQDTQLHFSINEIHPLKFIFCSMGRIVHLFREDNERHTIHTYQNIIVSSSGNNGHVLYFRENETSHVFSLEIIRKIFNKRNNYLYKNLDPGLKELFVDSVTYKKFFHQGNYSIKASRIVEEIGSRQYSGFLRNMFLEGKANEMLVIQIAQYHDDLRKDKLPQILRRSDVERIKRSVEIIQHDLSKTYSVDFLAKEVGTNVNKLQDGFRYLFNLTVNKYIQQAKLEAAKELLASSEYNISQIVGMIGLNNRSYFSKIFKEKYGVNPRYFLKPKKEESEEV